MECKLVPAGKATVSYLCRCVGSRPAANGELSHSPNNRCRLYQLTWRSAKLFSYDASNFDDVKQLATPLLVS